MAKKTEESQNETMAAPSTLAPGQARIKYLWDHYSQDWLEHSGDGTPTLHKQGSELVVDAAKANRLAKEYGPATRGKIYREGKDPLPGDKITDLGCPFEIIEENKAVGVAPETK